MPDNILNSFKDKNFSYDELKAKWNQVKDKKNSPDRAFLGGIFAFDNKDPKASEKIFNKIAASDKDNKTISLNDIKIFAQKDRRASISLDDFQQVYGEIYKDDLSINKFDLEDQKMNPYFKYNEETNRFEDIDEIKINNIKLLNLIKEDLKKYAKEHKDDKDSQEFLQEFKHVKIDFDCDSSDRANGHFYVQNHGKNKILLNYFNFDENGKNKLSKTVFHEVKHSIESHKDNIVSKREERDVEDAAITMTEKLYGKDSFKDLDKEKYLDEFEKADAYKDLPDKSKGHGIE